MLLACLSRKYEQGAPLSQFLRLLGALRLHDTVLRKLAKVPSIWWEWTILVRDDRLKRNSLYRGITGLSNNNQIDFAGPIFLPSYM